MSALDKTFSEFLANPEKKVLIVKGAWGVGKTFAWKRYIESETKLTERAVSYVSLFGAKDLNEVRQLILQNAVPKNSKELRSALKIGVPLLKVTADIPYLKDFWKAAGNLAPLLLKRFLVCFDDIERKSKELSLSAILGLASVLKEENDCRVVLIFNEDQIDKGQDQEDLKKYREKVVDQEIGYNPSVTDNLRLIFKSSEFPSAQTVFERLGINNIRIIKFTHWNLKHFAPLVSSAEEAVRSSLFENVAILTCLFHKHGNELDFDKLQSSVVMRMFRDKGEAPTSTELLLSRALYFEKDYDQLIVHYLRTGISDTNEFQKIIASLNEREKRGQTEEKLRAAWRLYAGNFQSTKDEVVVGFSNFLTAHCRELSYAELNQICLFLNELGEIDTSQKWKDTYIESRISLLTLEDTEHFKHQTSNPQILQMISDRAVQLQHSDSLKSVIYRIADKDGWNPKDESVLNSYTESEYYDWIAAETDPELISNLRSFHKIFHSASNEPMLKAIGIKLEGALRRLGGRSQLDRMRIQHLFKIPDVHESLPPAQPNP